MKKFFLLPNHMEPALKEALHDLARNGTPMIVIKSGINATITSFAQLELEVVATDSEILQLGIKLGFRLTQAKPMNPAQMAVQKKMSYLIEAIGEGPLSCMEEGELLDHLQSINDDSSLWGIAIKKHFTSGATDHSGLFRSLAAQIQDDIFTMCPILGQKYTIYLLRFASN